MNSAEAAFLDQVRSAQEFDRSRFVPFDIDGRGAGWIRRDRLELLGRWPEVFDIDAERVGLCASLAAEPSRTVALTHVTRELERGGKIRGWRNETYAVRFDPSDGPLFHIERAAMRFFGLTSSASHLNGHVSGPEGQRLWISRRSSSKYIDPGMLDTLVGGGIPSGQDAWQALLRECGEEAGIELPLAARATAAGALRVCREVPEGLHSEILHVHDLELPAGFQPRNVDGEVSEFKWLDPAEVADRVAKGEFTVEAGLVTLDFLVRYGAIADRAIVAALDRCRVRP